MSGDSETWAVPLTVRVRGWGSDPWATALPQAVINRAKTNMVVINVILLRIFYSPFFTLLIGYRRCTGAVGSLTFPLLNQSSRQLGGGSVGDRSGVLVGRGVAVGAGVLVGGLRVCPGGGLVAVGTAVGVGSAVGGG
jgi:hypothetical protein